jgi:hypothetical protein
MEGRYVGSEELVSHCTCPAIHRPIHPAVLSLVKHDDVTLLGALGYPAFDGEARDGFRHGLRVVELC